MTFTIVRISHRKPFWDYCQTPPASLVTCTCSQPNRSINNKTSTKNRNPLSGSRQDVKQPRWRENALSDECGPRMARTHWTWLRAWSSSRWKLSSVDYSMCTRLHPCNTYTTRFEIKHCGNILCQIINNTKYFERSLPLRTIWMRKARYTVHITRNCTV